MPRFSLDGIDIKAFRDSQKTDYDYDDDSDDYTSSSSSSGSSDSEPSYTSTEQGDRDNSLQEGEEREPRHPLGFSRTRLGLFDDDDDDWDMSSSDDDDDHGKDSKYRFGEYEIDDDLSAFFASSSHLFRCKPLVNDSKETGVLLKHHYRTYESNENRDGKRNGNRPRISNESKGDDDDMMGPLVDSMDRIAYLVKASTIIQDDGKSGGLSSSTSLPSSIPQSDTGTKFNQLIQAAEEQRRMELDGRRKAEEYKQQIIQKQKEDAELLLALIQREQAHSNAILAQERREEEEQLEEERLEREEKAQAKRDQEEEQERIAREAEREQAVIQQQQDEAEAKQREQAEEVERKRIEREEKKAKKTEYVTLAKKMVQKLDIVRAQIEFFENSKERSISKRRLQMKKVARGKMNTLSHDREKVLQVTGQVLEALKVCTTDDLQMKQQMQQGNTAITKDMTRGTRYLMDLIASTTIVRVQAEGFNGTRGDGFPLAHMLAQVGHHASKDFNLLITAHVYAVCPTAIPTLPSPEPGCSELELMESLGMQKDKKGDYETFDRFLARTEGLISIMANIMCSTPSDHSLFGGHKGALQWLERFLGLLPSEQSPLPLLTAPVLVAFLTAAGHLLANKYADKFKPMLDVITDDISKRLDTSAIGQPSSTRLLKALSKGMDGFKSTLPNGAIVEYYDRAIGTDDGSPSQPNISFPSFGGETTQTTNGVTNNSFGTTAAPNNPTTNLGGAPAFSTNHNMSSTSGLSTDKPASTSTPFGFSNAAGQPQGSSATTNPFGSNQASTTPFGLGGGGNGGFGSNTSMNAFGSTSNQQASAFAPAVASQSQPFGNAATTFGSTTSQTPFGQANTMSTTTNTPLVGTTNAMASNPFGSNQTPSTPAVNAFGAQAGQPAPNPFGAQNTQQASTPFGAQAKQQASTPFGAQANQPVTNPFGAQANQPVTNPFGSQANQPVTNPFGAQTNQPTTTPFGAQTNQPATTPFGAPGGRGQGSKIPCKFFAQGNCKFGDKCKFSHDIGGGNQQQSAFGGGGFDSSSCIPVSQSPFGANGAFGTTGVTSSFGNSNQGAKQPCKFFAMGKCRFGDKCKFSHDIAPQQGGAFGNSAPTPSPFGGGAFAAR